MSPEERELLERSVELAEENNKILRHMRRSLLWSRAMNILYWVLIIGSLIGAYYFLQPYIKQVLNLYNTAQGNLNSVNQFIGGFKK